MNKILLRYLIYFGIFICFVQIMESAPLQDAFAKVGLKMNFEALGTYAPLFLSALLIDITYRIGKRQNEIAERQNQIAEQQSREMEYQINKDLYAVVQNADSVIHSFLTSCRNGLECGKRSVKHDLERVRTAEEQINAIIIDIELRFPSKKGVLSGYNLCFTIMFLVLDTLCDIVDNDGYGDFSVSDIDWVKSTTEDRINIILNGIADLDVRAQFEKDFELYKNTREHIKNNNLAQTIKEHIITNENTRKN